ncbi:hypothetical protein COCVIDRAFT_16263 [Bipolaris victoriae FI3]|uniref:Uncharacterized protein n=1 Tax=Bipolaris victoriae (strain FI3) TaxID=930091 RepID=W7E8L0_BIPV3|nr:hypothetical protein COCVIDRAFT_16263 [Bipolaris victoriae FI3]
MSLPGIGHSFTGHSTPFSDTVNGRPDRWCAHSNDRVGLVTRHTTRAIQRVLRRKIHFFFLLPIVTSPVTVPTAASTSMGAQIACQDVGRPRLAVWTPPRFGLLSHFGERANHAACAVQRRDGSPCCLCRVRANTSAHISRVPGPGSDILVPSPASGANPGCPCTPPACLGYKFTRVRPR